MKKIFLILLTAIAAVSCSDNLEDLNKNTKDPSQVSGESLFTNAQKNLVDQMVTQNVNLNNNKLWAQYLQETTYTDESNYDQVTRSI
ncbi:MAG TPA: SusD/RagB family nutrient-binding outer membrane lipoprotein, partial [Aequorivita sp.]|nr:SusD/RagB family nutrient-binding outer membrane lipoprotein [Aequorivita sp.]